MDDRYQSIPLSSCLPQLIKLRIQLVRDNAQRGSPVWSFNQRDCLN
jgi:hypothetical protein